MEYFELVRTAFLVVGFLLAMSRDRATWMTVDLLASVMFGAGWIFFPKVLLDFQTDGELTGLHLIMCRFFGVMMICGAVKWYLNYQSHDNYAQVMLLGAKIVGTSVLLVTMLHSIYGPTVEVAGIKAGKAGKEGKASKGTKGVIFSDQWTTFGLTMVVAGLVGNLLWFLKAIHFGGHTSLDSRLNFHLRIDFFIALLVGISWLAYTPTLLGLKMGLNKPDFVQLHFGQSIGAVLIGDAILSAVAPGFLFEEDKRNILLARIVLIVGSLLINAHSIITYEEYEERMIWATLILSSVWFANALLGYYSPHETATYNRRYRKDSD